jgi:hypothetical protein
VHHHLPPRPPWLRPPFTRPTAVDPTGREGPTPAQARGPKWRRTAPGLYVPADVDLTTPEQRIVEAAGHGGALTGWARLRWAGGRYLDGVALDGSTPYPVVLQIGPGNGRRGCPGIRFRFNTLPMDEVYDDGLLCVPMAQAVFDEVRHSRGIITATVALDMAMEAGLVTLTEMREYVAGQAGVVGVPLARQALELADEHSGSPQETRLRLVWVLTLGLPKPLVNVAVFDRRGRLLGFPDLLDEEAGLAVEYDGSYHRSADRHSDDVEREAAFRAVGLELTRVTARDLADRSMVARRIVTARGRARFEPREVRRWTTQPPRTR